MATRIIDNGSGWKREAKFVQQLGSESRGTATVEIEFMDTHTRAFVTPAEWEASRLNRAERDAE